MKKRTMFLFAVFMVLSLAVFIGNNAGISSGTSKLDSIVNQASAKNQDKDNNSTALERSENSNSSQREGNSEPSDDDSANAVRVLVAYFSATNTTEGVAKNIADSLNAAFYEITPENPYTSADLDYHDDKSRSTIEMHDPNSRPAISGSVENMKQYDIVFIGYPIWWGEAPRILSTFVESYDFSGKTVVPFCTSGGSGIGSSATNLERLTSGATWLSGTRLDGNASRSSIIEWVNGLGLDLTAQ